MLRRLLVLEPLALGAAALSWFQPGGGRVFAMIVARSTLCLVAMILLGGTTPFAELLRVLRAARAPALLVTTLALMVRYLAVIADESQRMRRARQSRTLARGRAARWRGLATVAAMLFVRSSERAERVYAAMAARGWR